MNYRFFLLLCLFTTTLFPKEKPNTIIYLHPKPEAVFIMPQSSIILKVEREIAELLDGNSFGFTVSGEISGNHNGSIVISENTVIFKPETPFATSEKVNVSITSPLFSEKDPFTYHFTTHFLNKFDIEKIYRESDEYISDVVPKIQPHNETYGKVTEINGVTVPSDFPKFEPMIMKDGIAPGKIFINNWLNSPYIMIFENDGTPYFYQRVEDRARDFKVQPTGILTRRILADLHAFVGLDSNYAITDTFRCANGYYTDEHEIWMLENGHYFLIAKGYRQVDLSKVIDGGKTDAWVTDNHVQEFDENKNLIFEWLCYEHLNVQDAIHEDLLAGGIDYVHMNSIATDFDGDIITSSRHLSEVTKIHRETGEVIWQLGGVNNDFEFVNDEYGISYQHFARAVEGFPNRYLIFDNGNYHSPSFSRAVEYQLDTVTMTATMVWEFRHTPDRYSHWMGSAQRLPNGNTLIDWADGSQPKATEVTMDGEVVYDADFVEYTHTYRTYRYEWISVADKPYLIVEPQYDQITLIFNKFGDTTFTGYVIYAGEEENHLVAIDTTESTNISLSDFTNKTTYYFEVAALYADGSQSKRSNKEQTFINFVEPGVNFLNNSDFSDGYKYWSFGVYESAEATRELQSGEYHITITNGGNQNWHVQLTQDDVPLIKGKDYKFEFDAYASIARTLDAKMEQNGGSYTNYSRNGPTIISKVKEHYSIEFTMREPTDYGARVTFNCGLFTGELFIDNVTLKEIDPSDVSMDEAIPTVFELGNNYPNPFNPETTIHYSIPEQSYVILKIYSILGEEVQTLVEKTNVSGKYEVHFDASDLPSGIYFYSLQAVSETTKNVYNSTRKMVLIK